jgi:hypothetical protein
MHWLDPDYLPETSGTLKQFLLNPHGEIDGMILKDGTEVHFPPHMSKKIEKAVATGDKIKVRGVKPRDADVIAGVALETAKGKRIVDDGPDDHEHPTAKHLNGGKPCDMTGTVQQALHGPKGETRGVLLESCEIIRFPKHEAKQLASLLKPGMNLSARGRATITKFGNVLEAHEIGPAGKNLRKVGPKHHH